MEIKRKGVMKKSFILSIQLLLLFIVSFTCCAEELTFEDFTYTILADGTLEITKYTGDETVVFVPEQINDLDVTAISSGAFSQNGTITDVTLPDGIIKIGDHAFTECTSLKSVNLPEGLLSLGDLVFQGDILLDEIILPASLIHIGMNPFDRCDSLTEIQLSESNNYFTTDDGILFDRQKTILISYPAGKTDINYTFPEEITEIAFAAFSENKYLEEITIPENVAIINGNPFCGCTGLLTMDVSPLNHFYEVFDGALFNVQERELITYFWGTEDEHYTVPQGIISIAQEAFYRHPELKTIDLPNTLTTIKDAAFAESGLTKIKIPERVISLGNSTFSRCYDLESVTLPKNLNWIGNSTFSECTSLTSFTFPQDLNSIGEAAFFQCTGLTKLTFPKNLHFIDDYAFLGCAGITEIDFPAKLFSIGRAAFFGMENLKVIAEPGSLGEEWAVKNGIPVEHKNVNYLPADIA